MTDGLGVVVVAGRFPSGSVVELWQVADERELRAEAGTRVGMRIVDENGLVGFDGLEVGARFFACGYINGSPEEVRCTAQPADGSSSVLAQPPVQATSQTFSNGDPVKADVPEAPPGVEVGVAVGAQTAAGIEVGEQASPTPSAAEHYGPLTVETVNAALERKPTADVLCVAPNMSAAALVAIASGLTRPVGLSVEEWDGDNVWYVDGLADVQERRAAQGADDLVVNADGSWATVASSGAAVAEGSSDADSTGTGAATGALPSDGASATDAPVADAGVAAPAAAAPVSAAGDVSPSPAADTSQGAEGAGVVGAVGTGDAAPDVDSAPASTEQKAGTAPAAADIQEMAPVDPAAVAAAPPSDHDRLLVQAVELGVSNAAGLTDDELRAAINEMGTTPVA